MEITDIQNLLPVAVAVSTLGGAWLTIRKIAKDANKSKKEQAAEILHAAKEEDSVMKSKLEAKIESLRADLDYLQLNVEKDIAHLKETYSGEIKVLGDKIEDLRELLNSQHSQLLALLTKIVDKR